MRRCLLITILIAWFWVPSLLYARLRVPPGGEDVRDLAQHAPLVFRGKVLQLSLTKDQPENKEGIAVIGVDRWYRGSVRLRYSSRVRIRFTYSAVGSFEGHNCVDLVLASHWIFFAQAHDPAVLELFHDCEGALAVSALLALQPSDDFLSQIEADFRAGLSDSEPEARLASIQRLAGLSLSSSRKALREVISHGTETESKWALLGVLKTGDGSAVSLAAPVLLSLRHEEFEPYPQPEGAMALALENLRDRVAVPKLIEILNGAPDELVRSCASHALMEIKDPRALDAFADHLSDQSQYVRYNSLIGMEYITHTPACTIAKPEEAERAEPLCKIWWDSRRKDLKSELTQFCARNSSPRVSVDCLAATPNMPPTYPRPSRC